MREIDKIIIHCTDTPEGRPVTVKEVTEWHKARGFSTCGYHYLIGLDGTIHRGRKEERQGAHCYGQNKNSIGIAYVGGCDKDMKAKDTRTPQQKHALRVMVETLTDKYKATVHGHNEFSEKACPSFEIKDL